MEIFYSTDICGDVCRLGQDESSHCIRVLRHRTGDNISVIDGLGRLYSCRIISDDPKDARALITGVTENWGGHPYTLHTAVCPTKNSDRYEWFAEKACEIGLDSLTPIIGEHSERRVLKADRLKKILTGAAKQSLKGAVPVLNETVSVKDFIMRNGSHGERGDGVLRMIAYCFEDGNVPKTGIMETLSGFDGTDIMIMIGPEGDFSSEEAETAIANGFIPVHLGTSRLRTETAALTAVEAVYFRYM